MFLTVKKVRKQCLKYEEYRNNSKQTANISKLWRSYRRRRVGEQIGHWFARCVSYVTPINGSISDVGEVAYKGKFWEAQTTAPF